MNVQKPGIERRRYPRFPVEYPISYAEKPGLGVSTGMAMNLSEGGLLAYFHDRMTVGTELDLEMFYTYRHQFTSLNTEARIVWKDIVETSEAIQYQYGIEFTGMDPQERVRLRNLLGSIGPPHYHVLGEPP